MKYYSFTSEADAQTAKPLILQASFDARCSIDNKCLVHTVDSESGLSTCRCNCAGYKSGTNTPGEPIQRTANSNWVIPWDGYAGDMGYTVVEIDTHTEWS